MNKQDLQGSRTPADLERKYNWGKSFSEVMGVLIDVQRHVEESDALIEAELSLKIGRDENDQIVSMLNASANIINIKSNRLKIVSDYFKLAVDGTITATNANITGTVTANAGKIGGCDIVDGVLQIKKANIAETLTADKIEATEGSIGGWEIGENKISKKATASSKYAGMATIAGSGISLVDGATGLNVVFYAGSKDNMPYPHSSGDTAFAVLEDGSLYATAAKIAGHITATSGTIGGCQIDSLGRLIVPAANITGTLTIGNLPSDVATTDDILTETEVTTITNNAIKTTNVLAENLRVKVANIEGTITANEIEATSGSIGNWEISEYDITCGKAGLNYESDFSKESLVNDGYWSAVRFFCGCYAGDYTSGKFYVLDDGSLYASAAKITGDLISTDGTDGVYIEGGEFTQTQLYNGLNFKAFKTAAFSRYSLDRSYLPFSVTVGVSNTGQQIGYINAGEGITRNVIEFQTTYSKLVSTWQTASSISVTSDRNYKNSIDGLAESYGVLFDNLRPVSYKYNDGTSGRTHIGFVAQDVESAIASAGLTTQDFAGFVSFKNVDEHGSESEQLCLRYEEFIALNTWQIQRLKEEIERLKVIVNGSESN